jgi:hypothetical protein
MVRNLLSATALILFAAFIGEANAFDTGGEQISPNAQISPMTAAIVQGAQSKVLFPQGGVRASTQNVDPNSATGNPALDRTLGTNSSANTPRTALQGQLSSKANTLLQNRLAGSASSATFGNGSGDSNSLQSGGIPVVNEVVNVTRTTNVTNETTNTTNNSVTQTGNITNVKAVTKVRGNNNSVSQTVQGIGNGGTVNAPN